MKKYRRLIAVIIFSLLTIVGLLTIARIDFSLDSLERVNWAWLPAIFAVFYLSIFARGVRWQHILKALGWPAGLIYLEALLLAGFFLSSTIPARAGDIGRVAMLKQDLRIPISQGVASLAVERALDVFTVLILTLLGGLWALQGHLPPMILRVTAGIALLFVLGFAALLAMPSLEEWLRNPLPFLTQNLAANAGSGREQKAWLLYHKGLDFGLALIQGIHTLARNRSALALVLVDSLFIWLLDGVILYLTLISLGIVAPFSVSVFSSMVGTLATIAPLTPGALGQFEAALIGSLALFDISPGQSSLAALLLRTVSLWTFIPVTALVTYIFGFNRILNLSRKDLVEADNRLAAAPSPAES
ncbi:MAG: lysylphosphatidylglycerol synthase transmembrane domain-containing protein [Chloroflexota bacterium]